DTAEHYGYTDGYSEKKVGDFFCEDQDAGSLDRSRVVLATKYLPTPWRHPWRYPNIVLDSFHGSIQRTRLGGIDIYQLHGPSHAGYWPRLETLCDSLVSAYKTGKCRAIGVCNLSFQQVKLVYTHLKRNDVPLVSNQVEFSLVRQDPWTEGMIEKCHKLGLTTTSIAVIAYSPIALGRLTGKYDRSNRPRGNRNFGDIDWDKIQPIVDELKRIGAKVNKSPAAVAMNWVICKGAIPIPTVKNREQVVDCLQALGWRLDQDDEDRLD
ncbi:Aldo/keto reductase, partial [Aureobasidium namibiae CBS 147.97]